MATPDPLLRYATDEFIADGVTTDWQISFAGGYIDPDHVYAMSVVVDPETDLESDRQSHTVSIIAEDPNSSTARVSPAVAAGRKLYIYRSTPVAEMLVDYVNGSIISKGNLNLANSQLLKIIQEMFDNLNIATLTVDQQIGTVIDLNKIIQEIYEEVIRLVESGGIVSVAPRVWAGAWTGETETDQEFLIPGADVTGAGFYDTYVNGIGLQPDVDYQIFVEEDTQQSRIRFETVPAPGSVWFTVLRGYAKPYLGPPPITETDLRVRIIDVPGPTHYADKAAEYALLRCTNAASCAITVREIPVVGNSEDKLGNGSYFSAVQLGGVVSILADPGVSIVVPAGCLPQTRGLGSVITLTCDYADGNSWILSGDLAKE